MKRSLFWVSLTIAPNIYFQVIVSALAVTITFVYGSNDENPLRGFIGYNQWKPLIRWRPLPFPPPASYQRLDDSNDYVSNDAAAADYAADEGSTSLDSQDINSKAKRSRVRQPLCEVLVLHNIILLLYLILLLLLY